MQAVVVLLKKKTMPDILNTVRWPIDDEGMRYNVWNLFRFLQNEGIPFNKDIPTIEFRQHEGTLDS
jgi:hypothetical protein